MEWMTYVDSADLDFATESTFILVERYVVMVLYYSLGGDFWDRQFGFGGSSSVCDWNRVVSGLEQGILCNEEDEVTEVVFCKYMPNFSLSLRLLFRLKALNQSVILPLYILHISWQWPRRNSTDRNWVAHKFELLSNAR